MDGGRRSPERDRRPRRGVKPGLSVARGTARLDENAERITEIADLARRFPSARIVFSGGNASLSRPDAGRRYSLGPVRKLRHRAQAADVEDARATPLRTPRFTKPLIEPKPGERWLLVTSAVHMPRAVGVFRRWVSGRGLSGRLADRRRQRPWWNPVWPSTPLTD